MDGHGFSGLLATQNRPLLSLVLPLALGLLAAALAVAVSGLELKFAVGVVGALPLLALLLSLRTERQVTTLLVLFLAVTLSLNFGLTFFWRRHVGGAAGVQVSASLLCALGLGALWLYLYMARIRAPLVRVNGPQVVAVLCYMLAGVLSLVNAAFPELVGLELLRLTMLLVIMLAVMNLREVRYLRVFVFGLSIAVVVQASLAAIQHFTGKSLGLEVFGEFKQLSQNIGYQFVRPTGTAGHPNILAYFLESTIPIMLAVAFAPQPKWLRGWYVFAAVCGFGALILTLSRAAWLSIPFSLSLVLIVLGAPRVLRLSGAITLFIAALIAIGAGSYAFPIVYKRLMHDDYRAASMRGAMNVAALSVIQQYPVFGVGMNNFSEVYRSYDTTTFSRTFTEDIYRGKYRLYIPFKHVVHNMYLMIWGEVGTVGLVAFLSMFVTTFAMAWRCYTRGPPWIAAAAVGVAAGILAHLVHATLDPGFPVMLNIASLIFCLMGFIGAAERIVREQAANERGLERKAPKGSSGLRGSGAAATELA